MKKMEPLLFSEMKDASNSPIPEKTGFGGLHIPASRKLMTQLLENTSNKSNSLLSKS